MAETSIMKIFEEIESNNDWGKLFLKINRTSFSYPYKCTDANENLGRNRYSDVKPYDYCRVKLKNCSNDYINSSLMTSDKAGRKYILTQGPLEETCGHFWQMVWQEKCKGVVMLNKVVEKGRVKCSHYWPKSVGEDFKFHDVGLSVCLKKQEEHSNFVIRELEVKQKRAAMTVHHFHYTSWPDHGVPKSPDSFIKFMVCVQESGVLDVSPAVVHCSAGIGRTGTFSLVELCSQYLKRNVDFDVCEELLEMRKYRMGLIQTPDQLRFSYFAIARYQELIKQERKKSESSPGAHQQPSPENDHQTKKQRLSKLLPGTSKGPQIDGDPTKTNGNSEGVEAACSLKERFLSNDEMLSSQVTHIRKDVNMYKKKQLESADGEKETKKSSKRPSSKMS